MTIGWLSAPAPRPTASALPLLRAALAAAPERLEIRRRLARSLFYEDRLPELLETLATDAEDDPEVLCYVGRAAAVLGNDTLALRALSCAAEGGADDALGDLAAILLRARRCEEALDVALRELAHEPSTFKALGVAVRALLAEGQRQRLWSLCRELRAAGAWSGYIPSAMALAATTPEQDAEVASAVDPARWLSVRRLIEDAAFNAALVTELLGHRALTALPSINSTRGSGARINQLDRSAGTLASELLARVCEAVEDYAAERAGCDHPMIARRPAGAVLNAWAVVVRGDGHEDWHIHPSGWLSGVYYVAVPQLPNAGDHRPGAIEFGPFPFETEAHAAGWPRTSVMPRSGDIVLFPSYYGHRTWPTEVSEPRVCIAFDVVAADRA